MYIVNNRREEQCQRTLTNETNMEAEHHLSEMNWVQIIFPLTPCLVSSAFFGVSRFPFAKWKLQRTTKQRNQTKFNFPNCNNHEDYIRTYSTNILQILRKVNLVVEHFLSLQLNASCFLFFLSFFLHLSHSLLSFLLTYNRRDVFFAYQYVWLKWVTVMYVVTLLRHNFML